MGSFAYKHVFFFFRIDDFARNSGVYFIYCRKKIHVKNVKKHRKYFQIEEDGLIFCLRETNKHRFTEHRIPMQHKLAMEISNVKTGNFQCQHFSAINRKWRRKFPTSKLWSIQMKKFPKVESGVNLKWPWKFPTSKLWVMQNDNGNFQRKHFELSKWPWKFPTS